MNNRLLISLLALQVVSVANAFDPGFQDVEYVAPYKLRQRMENAVAQIYDPNNTSFLENAARLDDIKNMEMQLRDQRLGMPYYDYRQPHSYSWGRVRPDCQYPVEWAKYWQRGSAYDIKPQGSFMTRLKNWFSRQ